METINTTLPVYDRLGKQIYQQVLRSGLDKMAPTITPRYRLPSMQWKVTGDNPGEITDIDLIDLAGNITDIQTYFYTGASYLYDMVNDSYTTFVRGGVPPDHDITSCTKTVAAGEDKAYGIDSQQLHAYSTNIYRYDWDLTLNAGTAPKVALRDSATSLVTKSNIVTLVNGRNVFYLIPNEETGIHLNLVIYNSDTETTDFALDFGDNTETGVISYHPRIITDGTDDYFQYNGTTLSTLLTAGQYYLKFTSLNGYVYYSDWFLVDCVYENIIAALGLYNIDYDTFTFSGTEITSAVNAAGNASGSSFSFPVTRGETIKIIFTLTLNSGQLPTVYLTDVAWTQEVTQAAVAGLNEISLVPGWSWDTRLRFRNTAAADWETSEIIVIREYSEKYVRIDFKNTCDIVGIYYEGGFTQSLWLESETMEPTFPYTEKGVENGLGRFVAAYQRQDKIWLLRTKLIPQYIVDVLHRLKLHDDVDLIDTVGNEYAVKHVDVEHDWQFDDKYYATAQVSLDFDEYGLVTGCCS